MAETLNPPIRPHDASPRASVSAPSIPPWASGMISSRSKRAASHEILADESRELTDPRSGFTIIHGPGVTIVAVPEVGKFYDALNVLVRAREHSQNVGAIALPGYVLVPPEIVEKIARVGIVVTDTHAETALEAARIFAREFQERRQAGIKNLQAYQRHGGSARREIAE